VDDKVMEMLAKILENQNSMELRLSERIDKLDLKISTVDEGLRSEIRAFADELKTQREQNSREHSELQKQMDENFSLLKTAVANLSEETAHIRRVK